MEALLLLFRRSRRMWAVVYCGVSEKVKMTGLGSKGK